jgi:hypothetical protein
MTHGNLVCRPLLPIVGDAVAVVLGEVEEAINGVVARGSGIKLPSSGRDEHLLVGCPSCPHSAQGG